MPLTYSIVDAFTDTPFGGNPAAVLVVEAALPEALMQRIAAENNLSETAFVQRQGDDYRLRWFTPTVEVELCGHATLASAFVLRHLGHPAPYRFETLSGTLGASLDGERIVLDFPARPTLTVAPTPDGIAAALGGEPDEVHQVLDWLCVYRSPEVIAGLKPDFQRVAALPGGAVIVTAPGGPDGADITSRYFAPGYGIDEDPATGSAHTQLVPFWAARLNKASLRCHQASARGGTLWCTLRDDRVEIAGHAVLFATGTINVS